MASSSDPVSVELRLARWEELLEILYKAADLEEMANEQVDWFIAEIEEQTGIE